MGMHTHTNTRTHFGQSLIGRFCLHKSTNIFIGLLNAIYLVSFTMFPFFLCILRLIGISAYMSHKFLEVRWHLNYAQLKTKRRTKAWVRKRGQERKWKREHFKFESLNFWERRPQLLLKWVCYNQSDGRQPNQKVLLWTYFLNPWYLEYNLGTASNLYFCNL